MADRLHVRLDRDLRRDLQNYATENGLTISQAARELLRQALGQADPVSRGWREGYSAGYGEAQQKMMGALSEGDEGAADRGAGRRRIPPWMRAKSARQK